MSRVTRLSETARRALEVLGLGAGGGRVGEAAEGGAEEAVDGRAAALHGVDVGEAVLLRHGALPAVGGAEAAPPRAGEALVGEVVDVPPEVRAWGVAAPAGDDAAGAVRGREAGRGIFGSVRRDCWWR